MADVMVVGGPRDGEVIDVTSTLPSSTLVLASHMVKMPIRRTPDGLFVYWDERQPVTWWD